MAKRGQAQEAERIREILTDILSQPVPSVRDFEREFGFEISPEMLQGLTYEKLIHLRAVIDAARGNTKAYADIMDRMGGKPKQVVEQTHHVATYTDFLSTAIEQDQLELISGGTSEEEAYEAEFKEIVDGTPTPSDSGDDDDDYDSSLAEIIG